MFYDTILIVKADNEDDAFDQVEDRLEMEEGHTNNGFIIEDVVPLDQKIDELRKMEKEIEEKIGKIEAAFMAGNKDYAGISNVAAYHRGMMFPGIPFYNIAANAPSIPDDPEGFLAVAVHLSYPNKKGEQR